MNKENALSIRDNKNGDRGAKAQQLALLADSFAPQSALSLIATTLHDGSVSTTAAGPALANDSLLTEALRQAAVYFHTSDSHSPERDFITLSTSSQTVLVAEALSRLASAFLEIRGNLAFAMAQANQDRDYYGTALDVDSSTQAKLRLIAETFATVNACFILVISTTHARFDESEQFRRDISDVFQKLLQCDPFLKQLAPSFESLKGATSADARKVALRQFFETFCDEAQQPTLYDPAFSAVVQSMLLRELRQIIAQESRLPRSSRVSTPYLAKLFENRLRGELDTVRTGGDEPLAVISALRKCPQELAAIMSTFTNYLLESSDTARKSLTMHEDEAISSEVMLSVGCLLPESGLASRLAGILRQATDLNPALTLIFASAFKFSLSSPEAPALDAFLLIDRTLEILPDLLDKQRARAFDEILLPLAEECVMRCAERVDLWAAYPYKVQVEFIEKVIVRQIGKPVNSGSAFDSVLDQSIIKLLESQLLRESPKESVIHPVALRWLVDQVIRGAGSPELANSLAQVVILREKLARESGCGTPELNALLGSAGGLALQFLANDPVRLHLFVEQLDRLSESDRKTTAVAHALLKKTVLVPLERALQRYDTLLTEVETAELAGIEARGMRQEISGSEFQLDKLIARHRQVLDHLEENFEYLTAIQSLQKLNQEIDRLGQSAAEVAGLSPKELFDRGEVGRPAIIENRLKDRLLERKALMNREFSLGAVIPNEIRDLRKMSLSGLEKMQAQIEDLSRKVSPASEAIQKADDRRVVANGSLASTREEVRRFFELANRALATPIARSMSPEAVRFSTSGAGARLALVVRLNLFSGLLSSRTHSDLRGAALELEKEARAGLEDAIQRFSRYQDTLDMLNVFAAMNRNNSPFLASWPEALSVSDTDTIPAVASSNTGCSLAEYLYQRLRADIVSREGSWLTNEPGWNDSFHVPILGLFSRSLERQDVSKETKARALRIVFQGCCFWVKEHLLAVESKKSLSPDSAEDADFNSGRIPVKLSELLAPWSAVLLVSQGVGARLKVQTELVSRTLVTEAIQLLPGALQEELDSLYIPLGSRIASAVVRPDSALFEKQDLLTQYRTALKARQTQLKSEFDRADRAMQDRLQKAMPKAPKVAGLEYEKFGTSSIHLNLPPPTERRPSSGRLGYNPDSHTE